MNVPFHGTALLRAVSRCSLVAGLALLSACASYDQKPLIADDFQRVLEARSPGAPDDRIDCVVQRRMRVAHSVRG